MLKLDNTLNYRIKKILDDNGDNYEIIDQDLINKYKLKKYKYHFYKLPGLSKKIDTNLKQKSKMGFQYKTFIKRLLEITDEIYIKGGFIRDSFYGLKTNDLDFNFKSNIEDVQKICDKYKYPCDNFIEKWSYQMFTKDIEGNFCDKKFGQSLITDYTVNSMLYDVKNDIFLTKYKFTLEDLVYKKIRIPVKPDNWGYWNGILNHQELLWCKQTNPLRYFKLLIKGFKPINKKTEKYIINYINDHIDDIYLVLKNNNENIKKFLIVSISGGELNEDGTYTCKDEQKLITYLNILKKYLDPTVYQKIINILPDDIIFKIRK